MRKAIIMIVAVLISGLSCSAGLADITTTEIIGTVIFINGPYSSEFVMGDTVRITIEVDDSYADTDASVKIGKYPVGTLVFLSAEFESSGLIFEARGGPGIANGVTVYNDKDQGNYLFSDQLGYFGWDEISGSLGGKSLTAMEVDFDDNAYGIAPTMLNNDGLPTGLFSFQTGWVMLKVKDGTSNWMEVLFDECPLIDTDGDGLLDSCNNDIDNDGYTADVDCDDLDSSIHPGACDIKKDGIDQDCDGQDRTKGKPCPR